MANKPRSKPKNHERGMEAPKRRLHRRRSQTHIDNRSKTSSRDNGARGTTSVHSHLGGVVKGSPLAVLQQAHNQPPRAPASHASISIAPRPRRLRAGTYRLANVVDAAAVVKQAVHHWWVVTQDRTQQRGEPVFINLEQEGRMGWVGGGRLAKLPFAGGGGGVGGE